MHFDYSDVQKFECLLEEWFAYIEEDILGYEQIKDYLEQLTTPFGFLKSVLRLPEEVLMEEDKIDI